MIYLKSSEEVDLIRKSGRIVAKLFKEIEQELKEGISTKWLDDWIGGFIAKQGATSAFKGYRGFPCYSSISVNEEVVHGIPSFKKLEQGDIVSIDIGVNLAGYIADAAKTFAIGQILGERKKLLKVTCESLQLGIKQARPGNKVGDISFAIQSWVEKHGYSVVKTLFGHGVGCFLHEDPMVPNFGKPGRGEMLTEGMVLAIEPMVNLGGEEVKTGDDNWVVVAADGKPSAHFEHTIAILKEKTVILTK